MGDLQTLSSYLVGRQRRERKGAKVVWMQEGIGIKKAANETIKRASRLSGIDA